MKLKWHLYNKKLEKSVFSLVIFFVFGTFWIFPNSLSTALERFLDPHMYYVRSFVESLPKDVQDKMAKDAQALGMDVYEYNLQMCSARDEDFSWWSI